MPIVQGVPDGEVVRVEGELREQYLSLLVQGVHQDEDFEIQLMPDGNFEFVYKNSEAREFNSDYKSEIYSADGHLVSSVIVSGDKIYYTDVVDGKSTTRGESLEDVLLNSLLAGDVALLTKIQGGKSYMQGGLDVFALMDKYKEIEGEYWVGAPVEEYRQTELIRKYEPYKSQVANMLPKIERVQTDEKNFTETIDGVSFNVKFDDNVMTILRGDGAQLTLDVSRLPRNYVNNIFQKMSEQKFTISASERSAECKARRHVYRESSKTGM